MADTATEESLQERIKTLESLVTTMVKKALDDTATLHVAVAVKN